MRTRSGRQRLVVGLVLSCLVACAIAPRDALAMSRGAIEALVSALLDAKGITSSGTYTSPAPTSAQLDTLLGSTRGSLAVRGASGWTILAPGTSGRVLTSNGSGADPTYQAAAGGGFANPATADLDMGTHSISGVVDLEMDGTATVGVLDCSGDVLVSGGLSLPTTNTGDADETVTAHSRLNGRFSNEGAAGGFDTVDVLAGSVLGTNKVSFRVVDTDGLKVRVPGGMTITSPAGTTASGGYLYSTRIGSYVTIERLNSAATWVTTEIAGTWATDSTTSAGYAYTPTPWATVSNVTTTWVDANHSTVTKTRQVGDVLYWQVAITLTGAPTSAWLQLTSFPGGIAPSITKLGWNGATGDYFFLEGVGCAIDTSAHATRGLTCCLKGSSGASDGSVYCFSEGTSAAAGSGVMLYATITEAQPWTWAIGDTAILRGSYPVD